MCCSGVVVLLQWRGLRTEALGAHHTGFANTEKTMLVDPELELMCKRKVVWWKRHELAEDVLKKSKRLPICMCQCKPKEWLVLTRVLCKKEVLFCCCFFMRCFGVVQNKDWLAPQTYSRWGQQRRIMSKEQIQTCFCVKNSTNAVVVRTMFHVNNVVCGFRRIYHISEYVQCLFVAGNVCIHLDPANI